LAYRRSDRIAAGYSFGAGCLETARRDPRIRAVFPLAPGFRNGATDDFVATLARPLLFVGGSRDDTCEFPANQQAPYEKAMTPKYLLEVMEAGHLDFSNLCEVPIAQQFIDDGCDPAHIEPAIVQARTNTVATAFALRHLLDDARYDAFLAVSAVTALGNVEYWTAP
jgi:predicted dienelactone hydrolase